jgi:hypothetical protein
MALQELENESREAPEPRHGPLAKIPSLGFVTRRRRANDSVAWRATVTQHMPETWPAARLALQARIAALDIEA